MFKVYSSTKKKQDGIVWFSVGLGCTAHSKNSSILITHIAKGRSRGVINFHLKVEGAKSSGNSGDPMLGVAVIP